MPSNLPNHQGSPSNPGWQEGQGLPSSPEGQVRQGLPSSPEGQVHVKDRRRVQKDKDIEDHRRVQKDKYVKDYRRFQKDKYMSRIAFESRRTSTCQGLPSSPEGQVHVKDRRRILDDTNVKMIWLKMVDPC